jgi:hypothetical protein
MIDQIKAMSEKAAREKLALIPITGSKSVKISSVYTINPLIADNWKVDTTIKITKVVLLCSGTQIGLKIPGFFSSSFYGSGVR